MSCLCPGGERFVDDDSVHRDDYFRPSPRYRFWQGGAPARSIASSGSSVDLSRRADKPRRHGYPSSYNRYYSNPGYDNTTANPYGGNNAYYGNRYNEAANVASRFSFIHIYRSVFAVLKCSCSLAVLIQN